MRIRFQADNDLNKAIVRAVVRREPTVDFRSAQAARLDHVPDPEVLRDSARTGRILVSHDFQTMPEHFREFALEHHTPGVFLIPQDLPIGLAVDTLVLVGPPPIERMGKPALLDSEPREHRGWNQG